MDDAVRAAMARWPDVPAVYGWLSLSARGHWRIRGEPIGNAAIPAFINRNYGADEHGNWFFQNGPQRVYVELELAPLIMRLERTALVSHVGTRVHQLHEVCADEHGRFYFLTEQGPGALDDRDGLALVELLRDACGAVPDEAAFDAWLARRTELDLCLPLAGAASPPPVKRRVVRIAAAEAPMRFAFQCRPRAPG